MNIVFARLNDPGLMMSIFKRHGGSEEAFRAAVKEIESSKILLKDVVLAVGVVHGPETAVATGFFITMLVSVSLKDSEMYDGARPFFVRMADQGWVRAQSNEILVTKDDYTKKSESVMVMALKDFRTLTQVWATASSKKRNREEFEKGVLIGFALVRAALIE